MRARAVTLFAAAAALVCASAAPVRPLPPKGFAPAAAARLAAVAAPGDLIFVVSANPWANLSARIDPGAEGFGHVGVIARAADGALVVVHAAGNPGEPDGRVIAEPFDAFLGHSLQVELRRQPDAAAAVAAAAAALALEAARTPFDARFSLTTPDRVYCTELAWIAYYAALGRDPAPARTDWGGEPRLFISDLRAAPGFAAITLARAE